jgi:hypothetical protein
VAYPGTTFLAAEKWLNLIVTSINSFAGELSQNSALRAKSELPRLKRVQEKGTTACPQLSIIKDFREGLPGSGRTL